MSLEPPPFQESARCEVCKCSFNTFRRRHHCRCCGRTFCHEHSANQMELPQFGIHSPVRVCAECCNDSSRSGKVDPQATLDKVDSITDEVSRLDIGANIGSETEPAAGHHSVTTISGCKCGMPLCICEVPDPSTGSSLQKKATPTISSESNPKRKKVDPSVKTRASTSNIKVSSVFNPGQVTTNGTTEKPQRDYEASGEGLREAIKNDDGAGVKKLLSEGVDANYCDKQGMTLLHLAALFNRTDITFTLMENGASLAYKNAQGETPLDCAQATLQFKMRQKLEEIGQQKQSI